MKNSANPFNNEAGLVDKFIGTSYSVVLGVYHDLTAIKHVSENMQVVYDFTSTMDLMEAFTSNPDFLTYLQDNQTELNEFSGNLATLMSDYAPLAGANQFTGFTTLGDHANAVGIKQFKVSSVTPAAGYSMQIPHSLDASKVLDWSMRVQANDTTVRNPSADQVDVYLSPTHIVVTTAAEELLMASRDFHLLLTYME